MPLLACVVRTEYLLTHPNDTVWNAENGDAWFVPVLVSDSFWTLGRDPVMVMLSSISLMRLAGMLGRHCYHLEVTNSTEF